MTVREWIENKKKTVTLRGGVICSEYYDVYAWKYE